MTYLIFITILLVAELTYFKIADKYNIIDKPNHRSSHSLITIRGGGIIFPISIILWFFCFGFLYPLFVAGVLIISAVSFIDDIQEFPKRWRLLAHLVAMVLVMLQLKLFALSYLLIIPFFVFFIGVINAYNFMDGINGITGVYSLVCLLTLFWINQAQVHFIDSALLVMITIAIMVFNFFNFRNKAKCFAGDVGSISIALIICFLLLKLILQTNDIRYLLLLMIYGIDAVFTIIIRLGRGENIFQAHRLHLYQLMVNECGYKHLWVALIYGAIQLIVNFLVIGYLNASKYYLLIAMIVMLSLIYLIIRVLINNKKIIKTKSI